MKKQDGKIGYNDKWAKKVGKSEFLKQMNEAYPDRKDEHAAYWDKKFGKATPEIAK